MNKTVTLYLIISTVVFSACSSVKLTSRYGKDIELTPTNFNQLEGKYSNISLDSVHYFRTLIGNFQFDTLFKQKESSFVIIEPLDNKTLNLKLFKADSNICELTVKGKFKNGYFKVKRQWTTSFIAGPLLWILGDNLKYLGLTNENNLVIVNSGGGGAMLLIAIPIFAAGGGQYENEYAKAKQ
jgi:hypothetical protein